MKSKFRCGYMGCSQNYRPLLVTDDIMAPNIVENYPYRIASKPMTCGSFLGNGMTEENIETTKTTTTTTTTTTSGDYTGTTSD